MKVVLVAASFLSVLGFCPPRGVSTSRALSRRFAAESVCIISPPGGVGEVAAVKSASMGAQVRWFVVSKDDSSSQIVLEKQALVNIEKAGGKVELAGADMESLLLPPEDSQSSLAAVAQWCRSSDAMVATLDGVDDTPAWKDSIKLAVQQVSSTIKGPKIAILPPGDEGESSDDGDTEGSFLSSLLKRGTPDIPVTMAQAMGSNSIVSLRHGELFGIPESSPEFSPLVDGPRRDPVLCPEYTMRGIRVDSTLSVSGNMMMGKTTKSSRHAVGEAAALMALSKVPVEAGLDIVVSSLRGNDPLDLKTWQDEFERIQMLKASGQDAQLFVADFASVPDVPRLADWLATKWAPAVLRTYDIATIRAGARPVYAARVGDGQVEIVWQELVNFESVVIGKMIITVSDNGVVAIRGTGDESKGYGSVSKKPLAGENVFVRQLAEAVAQAVEKKLAVKAKKIKESTKPAAEPVVIVPVTSVQSSGTVETPESSEAGPRRAGARRSTERTRGKRRTDPPLQ